MVDKATDWPHSSSRYYELGEEDLIVDPYEYAQGNLKEICQSEEFERMKAIGSDWFQYQIHKKLM